MWWGEFWGAVTLCVLALVWATEKRHPDTLGVVLMLLVSWALTNVQDATFEPPESKAFNAVADMTLGFTALVAYQARKQTWTLVTALLCGFQMITHVVYQAIPETGWTTYIYDVVNNATYALKLAAVSSPGARDVVRGLSRLRDRLVAGHHRGAPT